MWTKYLIIGISGVPRAGKSTLAANIQKTYPNTIIFSQDSYLKMGQVFHFNHVSHDTTDAVNVDSLLSDINQALVDKLDKIPRAQISIADPQGPLRLLIIEGFIALKNIRISTLCDLIFHIRLPKEECFRRRAICKYEPPEGDAHFELCLWPEYVRVEKEVTHYSLNFIDGLQTEADLLSIVVAAIDRRDKLFQIVEQ